MVEMSSVANGPKALTIGPEYNAFLYATIGNDPNGSEFTVLSAMARMDLDPWQEAKQLSELSVKIASRRLAALIAAMSVQPSVSSEPRIVAERLIKLLPRSGATKVPPLSKTLLAYGALSRSRTVLVVLAVLIVLALVPLWSLIQRPASPPQNSPASSAIAAPPK